MTELLATPAQIQAELAEEFDLFDDWMSRYEYVIDLGKKLSEFDVEWKIEENKIQGCQSQVWLHSELIDGKLIIHGMSDAAIVKGLVAIVLRVYSGQSPQTILETTPDFVNDIGFNDHLSPTRSNGLHSMLRTIYRLAGQHIS